MSSHVTVEHANGVPSGWVEGCAAAQGALDQSLTALDDRALDEGARRPSLLPGWTLGHVLTHIARNADSVVWRLAGAARGEVRDQYPGGQVQRQAEIEAGAGRSTAELVADVRTTSAAVERAMRELPVAAWDAWSRNSRGEAEQSRLVVLSRWREVVLHHGDLGLEPVEARPELVTACLAHDLVRLPERTDPVELWRWVLGRGDPPRLRPWESRSDTSVVDPPQL
jgi:maleylpyruvate isomerase